MALSWKGKKQRQGSLCTAQPLSSYENFPHATHQSLALLIPRLYDAMSSPPRHVIDSRYLPRFGDPRKRKVVSSFRKTLKRCGECWCASDWRHCERQIFIGDVLSWLQCKECGWRKQRSCFFFCRPLFWSRCHLFPLGLYVCISTSPFISHVLFLPHLASSYTCFLHICVNRCQTCAVHLNAFTQSCLLSACSTHSYRRK